MANEIEVTLDGLYDNNGETFDRYTALFSAHIIDRENDPDGNNDSYEYWYLGMSEHPFHPQGFGQHGEGDVSGVIERDTEIELTDAPEDVQKAIKQEIELTERLFNEQQQQLTH